MLAVDSSDVLTELQVVVVPGSGVHTVSTGTWAVVMLVAGRCWRSTKESWGVLVSAVSSLVRPAIVITTYSKRSSASRLVSGPVLLGLLLSLLST